MISALIEKLKAQPGTIQYPASQRGEIARVEAEQGIHLPPEYKQLLEWSNGLQVYDGYERLFGINCAEPIDCTIWNDFEYWKFAWGDRCSDYWCFAESEWGAQYAYNRKDLAEDTTACVYRLSAFRMEPKVVASSFIQFVQARWLQPYEHLDGFDRTAHEFFRRLDPKMHLVYLPPPELLPWPNGMYELQNVTVMPARSAMICNGDVDLQFVGAREGAVATGFESYEDEKGRTRLRIVWE